MLIKMALLAIAVGLALGSGVRAADGRRATVIYDGVVTEVSAVPISEKNPAELWITTADLTRATKFEIKPQGVCREELCFPIPKDRRNSLVRKQGGTTIFNLTEFAWMVHQPIAFDLVNSVWFYGPRQSAQNDFVQTLEAPNFTLPDLNGKMHSLSDFRGKKVLRITWASW